MPLILSLGTAHLQCLHTESHPAPGRCLTHRHRPGWRCLGPHWAAGASQFARCCCSSLAHLQNHAPCQALLSMRHPWWHALFCMGPGGASMQLQCVRIVRRVQTSSVLARKVATEWALRYADSPMIAQKQHELWHLSSGSAHRHKLYNSSTSAHHRQWRRKWARCWGQRQCRSSA